MSRVASLLDEAAEQFHPTMTAGRRNAELEKDAVRVVLGGQASNARANVGLTS